MADMQDYWDDTAAALEEAYSIAFDGCHKIYVHMDKGTHDQAVEWGYTPHMLEGLGAKAALEMLRDWYEGSCALRFIQSVRTVDGDPNEGYENLIPQGAEDEEDVW